MDLMQEILQMKEEGKLNEIQIRWFATKPAEEFYDTKADPYELNNLVTDPIYRKDLQRFRATLNEWLIQINDKGFTPERDMLELMWPGGNQPETSKPEIVVRSKTRKEHELQLTCATEGASIAYKVGDKGTWQLYSSPLKIPRKSKFTAKAIRYGYKESVETTFPEESVYSSKLDKR
jgi:hypothetical protein